MSDADGAEVAARLGRADAPKTCGDPGARVDGRLPASAIQRIVRTHHGAFRKCYESALAKDPKMEGSLSVRFVIDAKGELTNPRISENSLPDCAAVRCVRDHFLPLIFPRPEGGIVTLVYPIRFAPQ